MKRDTKYNHTTAGNGPPNTPASDKNAVDSPMTHSIASNPFKSTRKSGSKSKGK